MAMMQSLHLEHLPENHIAHISLFESVTNSAFLHQQLLSGNTDFEYAFIDASVIVSRVQALAAVYRAANDLLEDRLKSRNVHSEIVFSLSPNNNIAESFRRFGISPTTTSLLVVKVSTSPNLTAAAIQEHLSASIEGTQIIFNDENLAGMTDWARVRKIYKLGAAPATSGKGKGGKAVLGATNGRVNEAHQKHELEVQVLGAMALRGAA